MTSGTSRRIALWLAALLSLCVVLSSTQARASVPQAASEAGASDRDWGDEDDQADHPDRVDRDEQSDDWFEHFDWNNGTERSKSHRHHHASNAVVNVGHDSHLAAGERADSVVSVFGSSTSEGDAGDVVSVFGNTRVTGPVTGGAVAVLGDTYVDSQVDGNVVAVLGNVELGPNAVVRGDLVAVGGAIKRDPKAVVHGDTQTIGAGEAISFNGLRQWFNHCLLYGRPLALAPGLLWAWGVAIGFWIFYLVLSFMVPQGIVRCALTLERQPGRSVVAALLALLLVPVLFVLLCVTLIGIAAIPFLILLLFALSLFGKAVMLAWIGRRCLPGRNAGALAHPATAILIGGAIVLVLYLIPVLGFLIYKILGIVGFGTVAYTLIGMTRGSQGATAPAAESVYAARVAPGASASPLPPNVAVGLPRAGFWVRMMAILLDALLIGLLLSILHHPHFELLVLAAYGAVMWKMRGTTIGGIVFDLQVVRLDGRPLDWETAFLRALSCLLSLVVAGLGFLWIAFDPGKQAWHDKIAGTAVVRVASAMSMA